MNTLLGFLKKHSDIDIDFIRDFIAIQDGDKTHAPFNMDLDMIAKWLDSTKGKIKKTLIDSYKKNVDYIFLYPSGNQKKHGGNNKEIILLTGDCFKVLFILLNMKSI